MDGMDENNNSTGVTGAIRASDAEREEIADRVRQAASEGRLTLAEADERLASVYAARMRHELQPLVADVPSAPDRETAPAPARWDRLPLAVHAVLVVVLAVAVLGRWVIAGPAFLWPIFPIFWAFVSLVVHTRLVGPGRRRPEV
jgi:hypothetical protein